MFVRVKVRRWASNCSVVRRGEVDVARRFRVSSISVQAKQTSLVVAGYPLAAPQRRLLLMATLSVLI